MTPRASGPATQGAGRREPILTNRQRFAYLAQAWHEYRSGLIDESALHAVVADVVSIFPVLRCRACGNEYVQHDGRKRAGYCSDRCRYRIAQREHRAKMKALVEAAREWREAGAGTTGAVELMEAVDDLGGATVGRARPASAAAPTSPVRSGESTEAGTPLNTEAVRHRGTEGPDSPSRQAGR